MHPKPHFVIDRFILSRCQPIGVFAFDVDDGRIVGFFNFET
jgi:hypothetical protein